MLPELVDGGSYVWHGHSVGAIGSGTTATTHFVAPIPSTEERISSLVSGLQASMFYDVFKLPLEGSTYSRSLPRIWEQPKDKGLI